jgi:hypothetical protein
MSKFYIATSVDNIRQHNALRDHLLLQGHTLTYDWTIHGGLRRLPIALQSSRALAMLNAVRDADFIIVLLPGGKGTHTEFGAAIGLGKRVFIHSEDPEVFQPTEKTSSFYHYPGVTKIVCPFDELIENQLVAM